MATHDVTGGYRYRGASFELVAGSLTAGSQFAGEGGDVRMVAFQPGLVLEVLAGVWRGIEQPGQPRHWGSGPADVYIAVKLVTCAKRPLGDAAPL